MNLNKVELIGNLVADPVARKMPSGLDLSTFRLATNYSWKDRKTQQTNDSVEFHSVVAWGKLAGIINRYLKKGSKVYLEGRLATRSWEDKNNVRRFTTEIIARDLIMLGHKTKQEKQPEEMATEDISVEEISLDEVRR
ncbi:MAG: single-stranded DNA-binding protein [Candidatus Komeilibacteria bacterium]|nr:single-stranded DNA-binding protein [Candidatus Komeilibacteria bacterium]